MRGETEREKKKKYRSSFCQLSQRLVGPAAFPLDRMNAILATLLEEHDLDSRAIGPNFTQPGEYTETELMRVHTSGAVRVLVCNRWGVDLALIRHGIRSLNLLPHISCSECLLRTVWMDRLCTSVEFRLKLRSNWGVIWVFRCLTSFGRRVGRLDDAT